MFLYRQRTLQQNWQLRLVKNWIFSHRPCRGRAQVLVSRLTGQLESLNRHFSGFGVYQELRYFPGGGNTTETVVSTSTGTPFINVGSYRHCSTALTAYNPQVSGPETYLALLTAPSLPMST
jgi:hypothetical protein